MLVLLVVARRARLKKKLHQLMGLLSLSSLSSLQVRSAALCEAMQLVARQL